jgi:hypothetical protein
MENRERPEKIGRAEEKKLKERENFGQNERKKKKESLNRRTQK